MNDLKKLKDFELIIEKSDKEGNVKKKKKSVIYDKHPLAKQVSLSYFRDVSDTKQITKKKLSKKIKESLITPVHTPSEKEILDICSNGEDQLYEFKEPGVETHKITKEIAAFLHTKFGGIIFYGIDDDGAVIGCDLKRQDFDQSIQCSINDSIFPQPVVKISSENVLGAKILLVTIPPWNRDDIYKYKDNRYYIRKGTTIVSVQPHEIQKLSRGEYIL